MVSVNARGAMHHVLSLLAWHSSSYAGTRNTRSYYLVESYRDDNQKTRRRTLCYLGREQDSTDTLAKALASWQQAMARSGKGTDPRQEASAGRSSDAASRCARGPHPRHHKHMQLLARAEAERRKREQQAEEALHWQSFERLHRQPTGRKRQSREKCVLDFWRSVITETRAAVTMASFAQRTPTTGRLPLGGALLHTPGRWTWPSFWRAATVRLRLQPAGAYP